MSWGYEKSIQSMMIVVACLLMIAACTPVADSVAPREDTPLPSVTIASIEAPMPTEMPIPTDTPLPTAASVPTQTAEPTATPDINLNMVLPEGNPKKGYTTAIRRGCQGCHANEEHPENGPRFTAHQDLPPILERGEVRISEPGYMGRATSNWEYFVESVYLPEAYLVPGEWPEPMSTLYYHILTEQEMADIVAWINSGSGTGD